MTPFHRGQQAYIAGKPISANPFPAEPPRDGDAYPGPYHEWQKGWRLRYWWEQKKVLTRAPDGV